MSVITLYELVGAIVTATACVLTYFRSKAADRGTHTAVVGLLGVIFSMLISLRFGVLPEINTNLLLSKKIAGDKRLLQVANGIGDAMQRSGAAKSPILPQILNLRLDEFESQMNQIAQGECQVDVADVPSVAKTLITSAARSYDATSYVKVADWWTTPWGKEYEELNYAAAKRGVAVQRTFIFSSQAEMDAAKPILEEQIKNGVRVRAALASQLTLAVTSDMVVVDGELAGELELTPEKGMKSARFTVDRKEVESIQRRIDQLRSQSSELPQKP